VASPIEDHAFFVRLMKDQQGCGYWYLYLGSDGSSPVVASASSYEPADDDEAPRIASASFLADVQWLAPSFEHFVYRYWIENVAWFELVVRVRDLPDLSPVVRRYLDHLRVPAAPPLDCWPGTASCAALWRSRAGPPLVAALAGVWGERVPPHLSAFAESGEIY
jgi:hypothetical protein